MHGASSRRFVRRQGRRPQESHGDCQQNHARADPTDRGDNSGDAGSRSFTRYAFTYAGLSADSHAHYESFKKDPKVHADLVYENAGHTEAGVQLQRPPHPKGMSGGGLWVMPHAVNLMPLDTAYLGGIAIEYHQRESLVFATRIEHVVDFIQTQVLR